MTLVQISTRIRGINEGGAVGDAGIAEWGTGFLTHSAYDLAMTGDSNYRDPEDRIMGNTHYACSVPL